MERPWEVTALDPLVEHEDNLWSIGGEIPWMPGMNRRMTIARARDRRLVFFNAVPVEDATLEKLRAWGKPWLLVLPHSQHMRHAHAFATRLALTTCAPDPEVAKVQARLPGAIGYSQVELDDSLKLGTFPSTRTSEGYLVVKSGPRTSVALSDVVMNVTRTNWRFKLMGFAGGPKIVPLQKLAFVKSTAKLKQELKVIAQEPGLSRVVVCHGDVIESGGKEALEHASR